MEQIIHNIFVGDDKDYEAVKGDSEFRIVRCCKYGPGGHQDTLGYHTLAAPDGPDKYWVKARCRFALNLLDLDDHNFVPMDAILLALDYAKAQLLDGKKVLFACNAGHSRGPSTALMFLRSIGEMPSGFMQSEKIFRTLYPKYSPAQGIRQAARDNWDVINRKEI